MGREQYDLFEVQNSLRARFHPDFFKSIPREPGVYMFKDDRGRILYVGKAKDLRRRISSYKQIKPGKNAGKLVRLLHFTTRIEWEICPSEVEALIRENELLRTLKPTFNRMNTTPEFYHYLNARKVSDRVQFQFSHDVLRDYQAVFGAFRSKNPHLESLKAVCQLFDFLQEDPSQRHEYQIPHSLVVKQTPLSVRCHQADLEKPLVRYLRGEDDELVMQAEDALYEKPIRCGFTFFQLERSLEAGIEFFNFVLSRNYQMLQQWDPKRTFLPKEILDDQLVRLRSRA